MVNNMKEFKLFKHVTDGGAVYLVDNHNFAQATIIIRLDGDEPELLKCEVGA
jgi:hypothetical protein